MADQKDGELPNGGEGAGCPGLMPPPGWRGDVAAPAPVPFRRVQPSLKGENPFRPDREVQPGSPTGRMGPARKPTSCQLLPVTGSTGAPIGAARKPSRRT